jgi:hypothetical protein
MIFCAAADGAGVGALRARYRQSGRRTPKTLLTGTGTGESIASIILFLQHQEAVTVFFSRIIDECHGASHGNKSKGQFYLSEVLLGSNKLEQALKDVIEL